MSTIFNVVNIQKFKMYLLFSLPFVFPVSATESSASHSVLRQSEPVFSETVNGIGVVVSAPADNLSSRFLSGQRGMPFPMDLTTLPEPAGKHLSGRKISQSDVFTLLPGVPVQEDTPGTQFYSDEIAEAYQAFFENKSVNSFTEYTGDLERNLKSNQESNLLNTTTYLVIYSEKP